MLQCHKRDHLLLQVTPHVAQGMLAQRQAELVKKRGKLAYDTAFGELCVVRAFFAWCIKKGWIARDPFAEVELEGQKVTGKPQSTSTSHDGSLKLRSRRTAPRAWRPRWRS
jgi:site-specific recombinase XerD